MNLAGRAVFIWFVIIGGESVHGALRAWLFVPILGEFRSNQIGVVLGSLLILVITGLSRRWLNAQGHLERLKVGAIWLVLTLAFEGLVGHWLIGREWESLLADYDFRQGGLMGFGLLTLFLSPEIVACWYRWTGSRDSSSFIS